MGAGHRPRIPARAWRTTGAGTSTGGPANETSIGGRSSWRTSDGVRLHFVHVRRGGTPLLLGHGWPSAFSELLGLVELLPGFDLVIPSLPGYGFSARPARCTTRDVAALFHTLMQGLGYERYGAGGGDFGAAVATYMALDQPERLLGVHLSNLDNAPTPTSPLTAAERAFVRPGTRGTHPSAATASSRGPGRRPCPTDSPTRRSLSRPGSSRSGACGATRTAIWRALRPGLPARARHALLGHRHDRQLHPRLPRQPRRRNGRARAGGPRRCEDRDRQLPQQFVSEGVLPREWANGPTPSSASPTCRAVVTSPPQRSRACSRRTSPRSSRSSG